VHITMIGQRGVPATFGGIEHHVEELGARLVARGHDVTVYCRSNYGDDQRGRHRGMRVRHLPTIGTKHLDAIVQSGLSSLVTLASHCDIVHFHALGPGLFSPLPRYLSGACVVQTIHGLDNQRAKWGHTARSILAAGAWLSARVPDEVVVVSDDLDRYYRARYGRSVHHIPNGTLVPERLPPGPVLSGLGLLPSRYLLFVGRLVPEKAPHLLLRAFRQLPGDVGLVLAGGGSYSTGYVRRLFNLAADDPRVRMAGCLERKALDELYSNALAFVLPSSIEGLPLTLLEAAAAGLPVVTSDIPPHRQVLGRPGPGRRMFTAGDGPGLAAALQQILCDGDAGRAAARALAPAVSSAYSWSRATEATEAVYEAVLRRRSRSHTSAEPPARRVLHLGDAPASAAAVRARRT
jgi:glycosyltransferase involved in cell wall biosynthesis